MEEQDPETEQKANRRRVQDLPEKLIFLADNSVPRGKHRLSNRAFAEACGQSESWLKSAKDLKGKPTQTLDVDVEVRLADLCGFDLTWPEWAEQSAADFKDRYLTTFAPKLSTSVGLGIALDLAPEQIARLKRAEAALELLDAGTRAKLEALSQEIGETRAFIARFFEQRDRAGDPAEDWRQKLLQFAEDFRKLRADLKALDPDDVDLRDLRDPALLAVDAGDIDKAKRLLSKIDAERRPAIANAEKELINAAEVKAALAQVALLEFAYP